MSDGQNTGSWRQCALAGILAWLGATGIAVADAGRDRDDITALLHEFLANVGAVEAHDRFWADDLVYTSSNGTRFGKADILDGMRAVSAVEDTDADAPESGYSGEDVDVRLYGDVAVVAFRLVATDGGAVPEQFFNTGTLVRRGGRWKVVAWQATRIPPGDAAGD